MSPGARLTGLLIAVVGALSAPAAGTAERAAAQPVRPPNVLIIVTDDQRAGEGLEVMDATRGWFGSRGISFSRAFATTPLCCPSRASIFTGRYSHNHGVLTNEDASQLDQMTTVQRYLREAGYRTGIAGKYLNGWDIGVAPPYFDTFAISRRWEGGDPYRDVQFNVDGTVSVVEEYSTSFIRDQAVRMLEGFESLDRRPWLLYVAPHAPHRPAVPESQYAAANVGEWEGNPAVFEDDRSDKPAYVQESSKTFEGVSALRRRGLRTLLSVDDLVDRIFLELRRQGELGNTLAFFLSDNGFLWAEHGLTGKGAPYLQAVQILLLARWGVALSGHVDDPRLAATIDIAPTILGAAGIEPEHDIDGRSLLEPTPRSRLLLEYTRQTDPIPGWASTLTDGYQYVEYEGKGGGTVFRELYDLESDPWQLDNAFADADPSNDPSPVEQATLAATLEADRACAGTSGPSACP
jgi:arylsulfatase A-like enzyme